jgi:sugar-specific transcriptional regulator TrmB
MSHAFTKLLPPQAANIYRLLKKRKELSAKDIGERLGIVPNSVYRNMRQLIQLGFVEELRGRPVRYSAKSDNDALDAYTAVVRQSFQQIFSAQAPVHTSASNLLPLTFIHSKKERHELNYKDIARAKKSINLIASGLEVPAEMILSLKRAIDRGVRVRIIVQNWDEIKAHMFQSWQRIGVEVRYYPKIEARIHLFDSKIVYLVSYTTGDNKEGIGVRFAYAPCARLLDEVFEKRWKKAKVLSK